jgi:hypothetical protein
MHGIRVEWWIWPDYNDMDMDWTPNPPEMYGYKLQTGIVFACSDRSAWVIRDSDRVIVQCMTGSLHVLPDAEV